AKFRSSIAEERYDAFSCVFFQAEDGIRDGHVTGVQTCALPISPSLRAKPANLEPTSTRSLFCEAARITSTDRLQPCLGYPRLQRSEERRVGKECRSPWST